MSIIRIPISKDKFTLIDEQDGVIVSRLSLTAAVRDKRTYVTTDLDGKRVYLHRFLLGAGDGEFVDHRNGDGCDNTRANLRITTPKGNSANTGSHGGVSRFKGVHLSKGKWAAQIRSGGSSQFLGYFLSELEAATAYDVAAYKLFGEMARLNLPNGISGEVDRRPDLDEFLFDDERARIVRSTRGILSQPEFAAMLSVCRRTVMHWEARTQKVPDRVIDFCLHHAATPDEVNRIVVSRKKAGGKLSYSDAENLRAAVRGGMTARQAMKEFDINKSHCYQVLQGKRHPAKEGTDGR